MKKRLRMNFVASDVFANKSLEERVKFVINNVKKNKIIVIDGVLPPQDEIKLIEETMKRIDEKFVGIEIYSLRKNSKGYLAFLNKIKDSLPIEKMLDVISKIAKVEIKKNELGDGLTFIGPSNIIKKIKKAENSFEVLAQI